MFGAVQESSEDKRTLVCPVCREEVKLTTKGVNKLPVHFLVSSLKDTVDMETKVNKLKFKNYQILLINKYLPIILAKYLMLNEGALDKYNIIPQLEKKNEMHKRMLSFIDLLIFVS